MYYNKPCVPLHCASGPSLLSSPFLYSSGVTVTEGTHHHWSQHNVCLVMFSPCLFPPVCTLSQAPSCVSDLLPCLPEVRSFFFFSQGPATGSRVASPATRSEGRQSRDQIQGSPVPRPDPRVASPATRSEGRQIRGPPVPTARSEGRQSPRPDPGSPIPAARSEGRQIRGPPVPAARSEGRQSPRPDPGSPVPATRSEGRQSPRPAPRAASPRGQLRGPPVPAARSEGRQSPRPAPRATSPRGQIRGPPAPAARSSSGPPVQRPAPALGRQSSGQLQLQLQLWAASPAASSSSGPPVPRPAPAPAPGLPLGTYYYFFCVCCTGLCCCVWVFMGRLVAVPGSGRYCHVVCLGLVLV